MKQRYPLVIILSFVLVSVGTAQTVNIPDPNLKQAIQTALNISQDPTQADMLKLTGTLKVQDKGVTSLTGLEYATNLAALWLHDNQITDISPLASLKKMTYLYLRGNPVRDISPLANLTQLRGIGLEGTGIADISQLAGLTNLWQLYLGDNQISDISPLAGLTKLTYLSLPTNQVADISALANLVDLKDLYLYSNQISDLRPLTALTKLTTLSLYGNQISDIRPLAGMTRLVTLNVAGNSLRDISVVAGFTNLTSLSFYNNQIGDISPLAGLTKLTFLSANANQIEDVSVVRNMTALTTLHVGYNRISDASPVAGLTTLTSLSLCVNQIVDVSSLAGLTNLTYLNLFGNQIADISLLAGLTKLTDLRLYLNQIRDVSVLGHMTALTALYLYDNRISDISALAHLTELSYVDASINELTDISALTGLRKLTHLDLQGNLLDAQAYKVAIPQILAGNPGVELLYDQPVSPALIVTATEGGSVVLPGQGRFEYTGGQVVPIEAQVAGGLYRFEGWTGSAVSLGKVADPATLQTTVVVDGSYSLQANFKKLDDPWQTAYAEDFEGQVGPEWSRIKTDVAPSGQRRFLGQFGNTTVRLSLQDLPPHEGVNIAFDLFIIRSWDGDGLPDPWGDIYGPDVWSAAVRDGPTLLRTTFDNHHVQPHRDAHRQSYPHEYPNGTHVPQTGATENNTLGYTWNLRTVGTTPMDSVYHLSFNVVDSSPEICFEFTASGLQGLADESWGLDNVRVELSGEAIPSKPADPGEPLAATQVERENPDGNSGDTAPALARPLAEKSAPYVDRTYQYIGVPAALLGAQYVRTAQDDKDNPNHELHITMAETGTLYLLLDNRVGTNIVGSAVNPNPAAAGMQWVTDMGFVDTGMNVGVDENGDGAADNWFSVFSLEVTPGVVVLKAQNDTSTGGPTYRSMYTVAVSGS